MATPLDSLIVMVLLDLDPMDGQMRGFHGFDTSRKLETNSAGSLTVATMSSLTISRSSCFSLSLSGTGTRRGACTTGLKSLSISMWYWPGNFPSPLYKHLHICAVC